MISNYVLFNILICIKFNDTTMIGARIIHFQLFYSALYATIFVVGLIGNGLLIGSLAKRKRISVPNIFLINLAISDLVSTSFYALSFRIIIKSFLIFSINFDKFFIDECEI